MSYDLPAAQVYYMRDMSNVYVSHGERVNYLSSIADVMGVKTV